MPTSFPFLAIARRFEVDYTAVLLVSDFLDTQGLAPTYWQTKALAILDDRPGLLSAIARANSQEQERKTGANQC